MDKIRSLRLHTRTGSIYVVANLLNPLIRGWQNYYCHFIKRDLNDLWRFVNKRLEKWCKWNKRLSLHKSRQWLHKLYKMQPGLFAHWSVCPGLLIENVVLKSRMNRKVHVRFCEEQGV